MDWLFELARRKKWEVIRPYIEQIQRKPGVALSIPKINVWFCPVRNFYVQETKASDSETKKSEDIKKDLDMSVEMKTSFT